MFFDSSLTPSVTYQVKRWASWDPSPEAWHHHNCPKSSLKLYYFSLNIFNIITNAVRNFRIEITVLCAMIPKRNSFLCKRYNTLQFYLKFYFNFSTTYVCFSCGLKVSYTWSIKRILYITLENMSDAYLIHIYHYRVIKYR